MLRPRQPSEHSLSFGCPADDRCRFPNNELEHSHANSKESRSSLLAVAYFAEEHARFRLNLHASPDRQSFFAKHPETRRRYVDQVHRRLLRPMFGENRQLSLQLNGKPQLPPDVVIVN